MLSMASFTEFHRCLACQPLQATLSQYRSLTCINRTNDTRNADCKSRLQIPPSNRLGTVQNEDGLENALEFGAEGLDQLKRIYQELGFLW
jgi:hypothetical protein|mmetsp:Transcript_83742/g.139796  ORF Transcript_83742/g.139796 Transcript_83742/m.139796 type:complete len:90 (+) Transcript_83742:149-418(+)